MRPSPDEPKAAEIALNRTSQLQQTPVTLGLRSLKKASLRLLVVFGIILSIALHLSI